MKIWILLSVFVIHVFATQVIFQVKLPHELQKRFAQYWSLRGERKFFKTYNLELPYLQYLHSREWYKNFFMSAPKFTKIVLLKKRKCEKDICILWVALYKDDNPIYIEDKWIHINGVWYHKYNDSALPIFR